MDFISLKAHTVRVMPVRCLTCLNDAESVPAFILGSSDAIFVMSINGVKYPVLVPLDRLYD